MRYSPLKHDVVRLRFPSKKLVVTLNPFDYFITREILDIKLRQRGKVMRMDLGENDFYAHFSKDGKYQLTWRFGKDRGFYFCKNGTIGGKARF